MRQEGFIYTVLLCATLLWCFAILAAPLFIVSDGFLQSSSEFLYHFFGRVCHQFDERSFHLDGQKLAVCARCSSIYFGFFLGLLSVPIFRRRPAMPFPPRWILFAAVLPMVLDVGLAVFNLHESALWTRALSGGVFGLIVSYFILAGFLAAFRRDSDDCQSATAAHF
ncbi:MAG: DUF2085 domain-containing protein [Bacteroidota bacterium]